MISLMVVVDEELQLPWRRGYGEGKEGVCGGCRVWRGGELVCSNAATEVLLHPTCFE